MQKNDYYPLQVRLNSSAYGKAKELLHIFTFLSLEVTLQVPWFAFYLFYCMCVCFAKSLRLGLKFPTPDSATQNAEIIRMHHHTWLWFALLTGIQLWHHIGKLKQTGEEFVFSQIYSLNLLYLLVICFLLFTFLYGKN